MTLGITRDLGKPKAVRYDRLAQSNARQMGIDARQPTRQLIFKLLGNL